MYISLIQNLVTLNDNKTSQWMALSLNLNYEMKSHNMKLPDKFLAFKLQMAHQFQKIKDKCV